MAGLNAQLRLVRRGCLSTMFRPVLRWLETFANPALRIYGIRVDLASFQATTDSYTQFGLLVCVIEEAGLLPFEDLDEGSRSEQLSWYVVHLEFPSHSLFGFSFLLSPLPSILAFLLISYFPSFHLYLFFYTSHEYILNMY